MLTVIVIFSIRPGCTHLVKELLASRLHEEEAGDRVALFATEIGEVNTLWTFHACSDLEATLARLDVWIDRLRRNGAEPWLRHVLMETFRVDATGLGLDTLAQDTHDTILLQEFAGTVPELPTTAVVLHPLCGKQGRHWVLRPSATPDEALELALHDAWRTDASLSTSAMLVRPT